MIIILFDLKLKLNAYNCIIYKYIKKDGADEKIYF